MNESFLAGACGYDEDDPSARPEGRRGVLLTSSEARPSDKLKNENYSEWMRCINGTPENSKFNTCQWGRYQFFIQTQYPDDWCSSRTLFDKWNWSGIRKKYFLKDKVDAGIRKSAQTRFDVGREQIVSEEQWKRFSEGLPKLCVRWVGLDGKPTGGRSQWEEFGVITVAWCE